LLDAPAMRTLTLLVVLIAGCSRLPDLPAAPAIRPSTPELPRAEKVVVEMPDLLGKTLPEARAALAARGFHGDVRIDDHRCYVDMPAGKVCGTQPAPGMKVALHRSITIHIRTP
jgi:hypothetical protein